MIDFIYQTLANFGYTHPLHPTLTHLPIGMVMGAFLFALAAIVFNRTSLAQTARHCVILGLLAAIPTALLGIMDWLHLFGGTLLLPFKMKIILAVILISFLLLAVILGFFGERFQKMVFALYAACLITTIGLGYFGGEIVYGTKAPEGVELGDLAAQGAIIFQKNCSACHLADSTSKKIGPGLKGLFKGDKFPISGRPTTEDNFRSLLKKPIAKMPPFGHLPDEEVDALAEYLKTL
jgi:mono/diheme cytochrome c family protein